MKDLKKYEVTAELKSVPSLLHYESECIDEQHAKACAKRYFKMTTGKNIKDMFNFQVTELA